MMNEDMSMTALFLGELRGIVSILRDYWQGRHDNSDASIELEGVLKLFRSVRGSASLIQLKPFEELSLAAENLLIYLMENNYRPNEEEINALKEVVEIYDTVSHAKEGKAIEELEKNAGKIEKVIALLNKQRRAEPIADQQSARKNSILDLIDPSAISILCSHMKAIAKDLSRLTIDIENKISQPSAFADVAATIEAMVKQSLEIPFPLFSRFGNSLIECVNHIKKNASKISPEKIDLLLEICDLCESIGNLEPKQFAKWIPQNEAKVEKAINEMKEVIEIKSSDELKQAKSHKKVKVEKGALDSTMLDLFKIELETQTKILNEGLLALEEESGQPASYEPLMRAAHSIKGAARAIRLDIIVQLAHSMEDYFVALQNKVIPLNEEGLEVIFKAVDLLKRLSQVSQFAVEEWLSKEMDELEKTIEQITRCLTSAALPEKGEYLPRALNPPQLPESYLKQTLEKPAPVPSLPAKKKTTEDRILRVSAQNLNRLMGLAGESMVEARWLQPFSNSLMKVKKSLNALGSSVDTLRESLNDVDLNEFAARSLSELQHKFTECRVSLAERLSELDMFISRHSSLADRLYTEVIESHMRPFSDGIEAFPRMVRDMAKQLNKKVKLEILGKNTPVDRDILQKLETPLAHLLRNAIDHGIEPPNVRTAAGKPPEGIIRLDARHRGGILTITVSDNGQGLDLEALRAKIIEKKLAAPEIASKLSEQELLDFLFLPGFSTSTKVTEISGRGMGLNVVQNLIQEVAGSVRITNIPGQQFSISLQLPLTLSVIRALIAEINGEPYAFPLARIDRALMVSQEDLETIENRQYFTFEGMNIGLVPAAQVLEIGSEDVFSKKAFSIIVISDRSNYYGLVVDRFLGDRELVVQEIDERLGKVPNIIAGSFMEDGTPVLIVDVEDVVRSVDLLLSGGRLHSLSLAQEEKQERSLKRILVVDDSITVREVECRLLRNQGYEVETAVNGADAWNAIRIGNYDLVITDVDMPRMNGIELVRTIKNDPRLKSLPIMIISYKEREADRLMGLEAGANYYLTKSSFHDETLIDAVIDLIGKP